MKATDLMIGDFAVVNKDGLCIKKNTIVEVREIESDQRLELDDKCLIGSAHCRPLDDSQFDGGIWCEYLDPIPLTPEILDKNGWEWDGVYAYLRHDDMLFEWYGEEGLLRDYRFVQYGHGQEEIFKSRPGMIYVHQLQHVLRLCGIEKEIEL